MADAKAPYGDVPYGDPGYLDADGNQASKSGKPGVKRYPLSADKVEAAWSYINQEKNAGQYTPAQLSAIKGRVKSAMGKHGHDVADQPAMSGRSESLAPFYRSFPLEDISIRAGGDGRTVEAYAAVFNTPAPVRDQDGEYLEELDPAIFNRAISDAAPQGGRKGWRIGVFYNHGMTIHGTPSERHSMPVGKILNVKADSRGLWTEVRYNRTPLADEVLENIREGSIPGYSFSGNFRRSQPLIPRGGFRRNQRTGELPHVRRTESSLTELGPTPIPVYEDAAVVGMRSDSLLGAMFSDPQIAQRMREMFSGSAPEDSLPDPGAPILGPATGDSHPVRSGRSVKEEMQAARSAFLQRYRR
jgi:HK97 family phage prohead protease